jgi:prolyl-tRNA synthetase
MSTLFLRTLREDPADAELPSHRLLVRAGYIRRVAPGIYTWLPLGLKVLRNVERIVREEMDAIGAQELSFPALLPKEPFEATGRWTEYGENIFRLKDRKGADYLLGPTHEEMFTLTVKDLYGSYKDLPLSIYQIQTKYRDEVRPRAGLLRGREFIMKDSYSFDVDDADCRLPTTGTAPPISRSSTAWDSTTSSSRPPPGRWVGRRPRSSSRRPNMVRTPTCAAPRATTRRTSRP